MELKPRETKLLAMTVNLPLLRAKTSEPMRMLIGAKDTKKTTPLGQFMVLDLNFL